MVDKNDLIKRIEEYIQWDPVESTRNEIKALYEKEEWAELEKRMMNRLAFGTAGRSQFVILKSRATRKNGSGI